MKFIKVLIIGVISFVGVNKIFGQQQAGFSLYNQFAGVYNPSAIPDEYTNNEHNFIFGLNARTQWTELASAPRTQAISGEYITNNSINSFNVLVGGYIMNDKIGPISTTGAYFRAASILSDYDPTYGGFSAGLEFGAIQYRINTSTLAEKYPNDILTANKVNSSKPQIGLGVSYFNTFRKGVFKNTKINTGISLIQIGFSDVKFQDELNEFGYAEFMHLYGYGKIRKSFGSQSLEFNTWLRYVTSAKVNADFHLLFNINEIFSIEFGTNTSGIRHVGFGLNFIDLFGAGSEDMVHITYSYNPSSLTVGNVFGNTHEIGLKYSFEN